MGTGSKAAALVAGLIAAAGVQAQATVLTFEDVSVTFLSPGYGGLNWTPDEWFVAPQPSPYNAHSGVNTLVDGFQFGVPGDHTLVQFPVASIFDGVFVSGFAEGALTLTMYLGNALVAPSSTVIPTATPTFLSDGYAGLIDKITIASDGPGFHALDDFTFHAAGAAIAEPETD